MPGPFCAIAMPILPVERVYPSQIRPPLVSCATSQNVMPAFGKRSEIGMNAEPMMPKACSMPCICKTFTKASSVVIFMIEILYLLVLKNFGELAGGIAKCGQMTARGFQIHARFRRLNGEGGEHLAVLAHHRYRHADDADEILLPVERNLLLADLAQFSVEPGAVGNGAAGKTPE